MGEKGRELYGLVRSPDNSLLVVCGGVVVVVAAHNVSTTGDVAAMLDETMHKSVVSFCVGGGDTKGK